MKTNPFRIIILIAAFFINFYVEAGPHLANVTWDENESLEWRLASINNEKEEIFASYLLFDGNKVGRLGLALMREAKRRGVKKVRLIVDGWPVQMFIDKFIDLPTAAALAAEGIEIRYYNPVDFKSVSTYMKGDFYKRSHDKLLYLRGQKLVHSGDANWQNVNFRRQNTKGLKGKSYLSIETVIQGEAADVSAAHMEHIWRISQPPDISAVTPEEIARANKNMDRILAATKGIPRKYQDWNVGAIPVDNVTFLGEHPDTKPRKFGEYSDIDRLQMDILHNAKPGETVILMAPYVRFMEKYWAVIEEARARDVNITIYAPAKAASDTSIPSTALELQLPRLQKLGIPVYEVAEGFAVGDFLHAKMWRTSYITWITSHNLNPRSTFADLESGFMIEGAEFAKKMERHTSYVRSLAKPLVLPMGWKDKCMRVVVSGAIKVPLFSKQF